MAYIKRNDAIDEVLNARDYSLNSAEKVAFSLVYRKLRELPTADVAEVKRGYWKGKPIAGYSAIRCSVCNTVFFRQKGTWKYCPNCGAEMSG